MAGSMPVAYVAGPYRSPENGIAGVEENIYAARKVARELWRLGFAAVCPHTNTALFDFVDDDDLPPVPDGVWLEGYIRILERCDFLVTVPGWESSAGARAEVERAHELGKPAFHWPEDRAKLAAMVGTGTPASEYPRAHFRAIVGSDLPSDVVEAGLTMARLMSESGNEAPLEDRREKALEMARLGDALAATLSGFADVGRLLGASDASEPSPTEGDRRG